jgi:hypothetical protein
MVNLDDTLFNRRLVLHASVLQANVLGAPTGQRFDRSEPGQGMSRDSSGSQPSTSQNKGTKRVSLSLLCVCLLFVVYYLRGS